MGTGPADEAGAARARLLGDIVRDRARVLELQYQGHYADAGQIVDELLIRLSELTPVEVTPELGISLVPHVLQSIALLADTSLGALAVGDNAEAAQRLRALAQVTAQIGELADQVAGLGARYCKDGRPSLDGGCLQIPPCDP